PVADASLSHIKTPVADASLSHIKHLLPRSGSVLARRKRPPVAKYNYVIGTITLFSFIIFAFINMKVNDEIDSNACFFHVNVLKRDVYLYIELYKVIERKIHT
ncbi:hypothetical protein, partial [Lysinibacillus sphaericus]